LRKQLKKENVKVIFTRGRTIGDLICNNKPKIPRERWKNKVYQIPCKDCEKIYIGETGQWFDERESQHKRAVSNKDTTNGIAQHVYVVTLFHQVIDWFLQCISFHNLYRGFGKLCSSIFHKEFLVNLLHIRSPIVLLDPQVKITFTFSFCSCFCKISDIFGT